MTETDSNALRCATCGEEVEAGSEWLLLNRWGLCTGSLRGLRTEVNIDGEYDWHLDPDPEADDYATGPVMHWPICATQYIEGHLATLRVIGRSAAGN